jgi:hypothetical protein
VGHDGWVNERAAEPASPRPRRTARPSWLDPRLLLGVALVLASVLAGAKLVSSAEHTYPTVAARHDLAAGTILTAGDLTAARVQLPGRGHGLYLTRLADAVGKRLSRPVSAGELLPAAAVADLPEQTTVTVPLDAGAAPDLHKGERIELWVSTGSCASVVLLNDVAVQAVRDADTGAFGTVGSGQDVVISVAPPLADRLIAALALHDVQLRAGVLVGSSSGTAAPAALPDLAPCAGTPR